MADYRAQKKAEEAIHNRIWLGASGTDPSYAVLRAAC